nr:glutamine amidotransferase [Amycolatopsis circi]
MRESAPRIGLVLPGMLGTYGDSGNATVLVRRLRWRGIPAAVTEIDHDTPIPSSLDLYLVGGGEDAAQELAASRLRSDPGLRRAAGRGAAVLEVCAGLQILGQGFTTGTGAWQPGAGLLDLTTSPGTRRSVGEIVVRAGSGIGLLTGFENHLGRTRLGPGSQPLGRVTAGTGNGDGTDGAVTGKIVATYLHGPVLARNPALADLLLSWALGTALGPCRCPKSPRCANNASALPDPLRRAPAGSASGRGRPLARRSFAAPLPRARQLLTRSPLTSQRSARYAQ